MLIADLPRHTSAGYPMRRIGSGVVRNDDPTAFLSVSVWALDCIAHLKQGPSSADFGALANAVKEILAPLEGLDADEPDWATVNEVREQMRLFDDCVIALTEEKLGEVTMVQMEDRSLKSAHSGLVRYLGSLQEILAYQGVETIRSAEAAQIKSLLHGKKPREILADPSITEEMKQIQKPLKELIKAAGDVSFEHLVAQYKREWQSPEQIQGELYKVKVQYTLENGDTPVSDFDIRAKNDEDARNIAGSEACFDIVSGLPGRDSKVRAYHILSSELVSELESSLAQKI